MDAELHGSSAEGISPKSLLSRGSVYGLATLFSMASGVLILPFVTRLLSPSEFGYVALGAVLQQVLTIIAHAGLPSSVTRFHYDSGELGRDSALLVPATWLVAAGVVLAAFLGYPMWGPILVPAIPVTVVLVAIGSGLPLAGLASVTAHLHAQDRAGLYVLVNVGIGVIPPLIGVASVLLLSPTALTFLTAGLGARAALALVGVLVVRMPAQLPSATSFHAALRLALPVVPHLLAMYVLTAGDRLVIGRYLGAAEVAKYQVAYQVGSLVILALTALNNAWVPMLYALRGPTTRYRALAESATALAQVNGLLIAGLALLSPLALRIAAPVEYEVSELLPIVVLVSACGIPYLHYLASVHVLFQEKRSLVLAVASPVSAATNVALNILLVPKFGLGAAAGSTALAYTLQALIVHLVGRRVVRTPWRYKLHFAVDAAAGGFAGITLLIGDSGTGLVARLTLCGLVTALLVLRLAFWWGGPSAESRASGSEKSGAYRRRMGP